MQSIADTQKLGNGPMELKLSPLRKGQCSAGAGVSVLGAEVQSWDPDNEKGVMVAGVDISVGVQ